MVRGKKWENHGGHTWIRFPIVISRKNSRYQSWDRSPTLLSVSKTITGKLKWQILLTVSMIWGAWSFTKHFTDTNPLHYPCMGPALGFSLPKEKMREAGKESLVTQSRVGAVKEGAKDREKWWSLWLVMATLSLNVRNYMKNQYYVENNPVIGVLGRLSSHCYCLVESLPTMKFN